MDCSLSVGNSFAIGSSGTDPCPLVSKYTEIAYKCVWWKLGRFDVTKKYINIFKIDQLYCNTQFI